MTRDESRGGWIDAMTAGAFVPAVGEVGDGVGEVGGGLCKVDGAGGDVGDGVEDVPDRVEDVAAEAVEDVGEVDNGARNFGGGELDIGRTDSIAVSGCSGSRSTMSPHIAAAPSNPLPRAAATIRERAGGFTRPGTITTGDVKAAGAGMSGGGLTSRDEGVAAACSRNGRISASASEAGSAGVGVVRGVCSACAIAGAASTSPRTASSGVESAARMAAAISATF